jgi:predicted phosphoadenosine phosphosulfate sulfurtransferase
MKIKIQNYITEWESRCYSNGIPDEAPLRLEQLNKVPSYKSIVRAIMKNDTTLKSIGFIQKKCKSYHELKRVELEQRNKPIQLKILFYERV